MKQVGVVSVDQKLWPILGWLTSGLTESGVDLNAGDILIEYHPHSKKGTCILNPEEFKESLNNFSEATEPLDAEPWRPFRSREDFEFADLVHDATLNQTQIKRFIKLIKRCQDVPGSFTLQSYSDLKDSLDNASKLLTPVTILPYVLN